MGGETRAARRPLKTKQGAASWAASWAAAAVFALTAALSVAPGAAEAGPVEDSRAVVERQLEAFSRDAWAEAFAFASPGIQQKFGTAEMFGRMVREGYPMVWRPSAVEFLDPEQAGPYLVQRLRLVDAGGAAYVARYYMAEGAEGWRIDGVAIERLREPTA